MDRLDTAFSPCPNDTFIFHAMLHGLVDTGAREFIPHIEDVETLNRAAVSGAYALTKLSMHAFLRLDGRYGMLDAGAALGFGCGPLLVTRGERAIDASSRVAIPGELTTAYLLLRLWRPELVNTVPVRFDGILAGVADGRDDAGLIIHEGRFVYQRYGLDMAVDLGEWWERETGLPIPLGCIALRTDHVASLGEVNAVMAASVRHARAHPADSAAFVRQYAQEMEDAVIAEHIRLYVNDFTGSLGDTGRRAVDALRERALRAGVL